MKNLFWIITLAVIFLWGINVYGQSGGRVSPILGGSTPALSAGFVEPTGSLFSYMPVSSTTGYSSQVDWGNWKCYQSFSGVSSSFNTVTIWVMHDVTPNIPRSIRVEVYSSGSTPGTLISSTTLNVTPVSIGLQVIGYDIWEYTMVIPAINLSSGWISVQALAGGIPAFYWLETNATPVHPAYQTDGSSIYQYTTFGLAMCLSNPQAVPFSKWAVIAGFLLIIGVVSFPFIRRMF